MAKKKSKAKPKPKPKESVKDRVDKLDERVPALIKRYPVVFLAVSGGGVLVGFLLAMVLF